MKMEASYEWESTLLLADDFSKILAVTFHCTTRHEVRKKD